MTLPDLRLSLQFSDASHRALLPRHRVARWIRHALAVDGEITVRIVGEAEGRQLNRSYRAKDYATNVLSFPADETIDGVRLLGDLALCAPVIAREAGEQGKSVRAHHAHLTVHGVLHLLGHDHEDAAGAERMEALEIRILASLGYANPYEELRP